MRCSVFKLLFTKIQFVWCDEFVVDVDIMSLFADVGGFGGFGETSFGVSLFCLLLSKVFLVLHGFVCSWT